MCNPIVNTTAGIGNTPAGKDTPQFKTCSKCGASKLVSEFSRNKTRKDGLQHRCRDCTNSDNKAWRESNPGKESVRKKNWRKNNPGKVARHHKTWREANLDYVAAKHKAWRKANPGRLRIIQKASDANFKAKKLGVIGTLTAQDVADLFKKYPRCLKCGSENDITIDHVIPLSLNGPNTPANLQTLCNPCNMLKSDKTADYRPGANNA